MDEKAKVFISSIMNASLEDLRGERRVAREVVDSFPVLSAWAFEKAPASFEDLDESYLRHVEECDIFVVIVGSEASNPVAAEVQRAIARNKPILIFAKTVPNRKPMAQMILDSAGRKYASFVNLAEFEEAVRDALNQTLVQGLRGLSAGPKSALGELRQLERTKRGIRIQPIVPTFPGEYSFHIERIDEKNLTVCLERTRESIVIPVRRVTEVLDFGEREAPILVLQGRLQWITTIQRWRFRQEEADPDSLLGIHKDTTINDLRAKEIIEQLGKQNFQAGWTYEPEVPGKINASYQPVYDDDGRYFRCLDRPHNLVLIVKRQGWPTSQSQRAGAHVRGRDLGGKPHIDMDCTGVAQN
jgi:hypothetical protein